MPTHWESAEVFMTHRGVNIYHIYKDDDLDQCVRHYWYALTDHGSDAGDSCGEFDIRDLPGWRETGDPAQYRAVIRRALDGGFFDGAIVDGEPYSFADEVLAAGTPSDGSQA
jgi:hypothetical protein